MGLREINRRNTLAVTQRTGIEMFTAHGFDAVKVADIAAEVGMAPSTLYRHFPTKESIVVWDEHAEDDGTAIEDALRRLPPFAALREAFVTDMAGRFEDDREFQLPRMQLMYRTTAIHAAALEAEWNDRVELAAGLRHFVEGGDEGTAWLLAGAAMMAIDWAFDRWQATDGATPLGELVAASFDRIAHLDAIR